MRALLLACALAVASAFTPAPSLHGVRAAQESDIDRQTREVSSQLRCVVCQGLSIQDSPSSLAQEMRALVREQLAAGRTPAQVKEYFVQKYGEFVLLEPDPTGFNLLVYLLPVLLLVGGAFFVYFKAKQWTSRTASVG